MVRSVAAGVIVGLVFGSAFGAEPKKPLSTLVDNGTVGICEQCMNSDVCQDKCKAGVDRCQYGCSATDNACKDPCAREHQRCAKWCADAQSRCAGCPDPKGR